MKEKIIFYVQKSIILLIAIVSLLTLCFSFISISGDESGVTFKIAVNGFAMLPGGTASEIDPSLISYAHFMLFILIASIMLIVISIVSFFLKGDKISTIIITVAITISLFYLCMAISEINYTSLELDEYNYVNITTASFVPLIIEFVLIATYFVLNIFKTNQANNSFVKPKENKNNQLSPLSYPSY